MSELIVEEVEPHIVRVTINRPEARNAINGAVARCLEAAVEASEQDDRIRCVILTGAGEQAFCAGADLKEVAAGRIGELGTARGGFAGFVRAKRTKPWIAAVAGAALAGGSEIVLACDMCVAAEGASFGLPEVRRGLAATAGGLYRLPRALPRAVAMELISTGKPLSAERAFHFGLVNQIVDAEELPVAALAMARAIAGNAPLAVRESLSVARAAFDATEAELDALSAAAGERLSKTEDYREGPRAFIEKRAPHWTGR